MISTQIYTSVLSFISYIYSDGYYSYKALGFDLTLVLIYAQLCCDNMIRPRKYAYDSCTDDKHESYKVINKNNKNNEIKKLPEEIEEAINIEKDLILSQMFNNKK